MPYGGTIERWLIRAIAPMVALTPSGVCRRRSGRTHLMRRPLGPFMQILRTGCSLPAAITCRR